MCGPEGVATGVGVNLFIAKTFSYTMKYGFFVIKRTPRLGSARKRLSTAYQCITNTYRVHQLSTFLYDLFDQSATIKNEKPPSIRDKPMKF